MPKHLLKSRYTLESPPVTVIELSERARELDELELIDEFTFDRDMKYIALCMDNVSYINSRGCEELVRLHNAVQSRGFMLFVVNPLGPVAKVMEEIGCFRILNVVASLNEALGEAELFEQKAN